MRYICNPRVVQVTELSGMDIYNIIMARVRARVRARARGTHDAPCWVFVNFAPISLAASAFDILGTPVSWYPTHPACHRTLSGLSLRRQAEEEAEAEEEEGHLV